MRMIRFIADIIGINIVLFQEHATLGPVQKIIFSPDTGEVLALFVHDPIEKKNRIIQPAGIKRMAGDVIVADGYDALTDVADVIRIKEAVDINAAILKEKAYTESGQFLGHVVNASIQTIGWRLDRIYVNPPLGLKFLTSELIIPAKKIVRIEKKKIYVADDYAKVKVPKLVPLPKPILE